MRLVDAEGKDLVVGNTYHTFRHETVVLKSIELPHHAGSTGRVYVQEEGATYTSSFFPSVIGAYWVERDDQD